MLAQLKCSGMLAAVRARKSGYPVRIPFEDFLRRYKLTARAVFLEKNSLKELPASAALDQRSQCLWVAEQLFNIEKSLKKDEKSEPQWQVGVSRVFLRSTKMKTHCEQLRALHSRSSHNEAAIGVQAFIRGWIARKKCSQLFQERMRVLEDARYQQRCERGVMEQEDVASAECERLFRSDEALQQQIRRSRQVVDNNDLFENIFLNDMKKVEEGSSNVRKRSQDSTACSREIDLQTARFVAHVRAFFRASAISS